MFALTRRPPMGGGSGLQTQAKRASYHPSYQGCPSDTPLHTAIRRRDGDLVRKLITQASVREANEYGDTCLTLLCRWRQSHRELLGSLLLIPGCLAGGVEN